MSAKDDFLQKIGSTYEAWVDEFVDAYAHELAEKQRVYAWGKRQSFQDEHAEGAIAAADLIDPESS